MAFCAYSFPVLLSFSIRDGWSKKKTASVSEASCWDSSCINFHFLKWVSFGHHAVQQHWNKWCRINTRLCLCSIAKSEALETCRQPCSVSVLPDLHIVQVLMCFVSSVRSPMCYSMLAGPQAFRFPFTWWECWCTGGINVVVNIKTLNLFFFGFWFLRLFQKLSDEQG